MRIKTAIVVLGLVAVPAVATAQLPPGGSSLLGHSAARPGPVVPPATTANSATESAKRDRIRSATLNGTIELRNKLLAVPIRGEVTVRDFLDKTDSLDAIDDVVKAAVPQGRPVLNEHTCQVRLTVRGATLLAALQAVARAHPDRAPVKAEQMRVRAPWAAGWYTATGISADAAAAEQAPRPQTPAWAAVSDADRRQAIGTARAAAVRQVIDAVGKVTLGPDGRTLAATLDKPAVASRVLTFLNAQPVSPVDFHDDLTVSLTLYVNYVDLATVVRSAAKDEGVNATGAGWDAASAGIERLPPTVVGLSKAGRPAGSALDAVVLPMEPPAGVGSTLTADGTAAGGATQLMTGHAAVTEATVKLRDKLLHLQITPTRTLADAVRSDSSLAEKVERALRKATAERTYNADGSVVVKLTLDVATAWDELR